MGKKKGGGVERAASTGVGLADYFEAGVEVDRLRERALEVGGGGLLHPLQLLVLRLQPGAALPPSPDRKTKSQRGP